MPNMSYCMFEKTYGDLKDCFEALANKDLRELSETERKYAIKLIKLSKDIVDDFEDYIN